MGLRTHVGQLRALIEDVDPEIVRLVLESWLTPDELNRGLMTFEPTDLREAGFFDAIKRISNTHRKSRDTRACPKGQKMVFGTCREIGATGDTPPKDFFCRGSADCSARARCVYSNPRTLEEGEAAPSPTQGRGRQPYASGVASQNGRTVRTTSGLSSGASRTAVGRGSAVCGASRAARY
jgi:hypothetical protein